MAERLTSYRLGEGQTFEGQVVQFTAAPDEFEIAKNALSHFGSISLPVAHKVNVEHGGLGRYSRYDIEQHKYSGGQNESGAGGYYEILTIGNPPDDRHPIVSHGHMSAGNWFENFFVEWKTVKAATAHHSKAGYIPSLKDFKDGKQIPGLKRVVNAGYLTPWFYATGDISLVGDYAFPEHLAQDPIYSFGRKFLVPIVDKASFSMGAPEHALKTCMGCVVREENRSESSYYRSYKTPETVGKYRAVQWHDGTVSEVYPRTRESEIPVPLADSDTWVAEAQTKFNRLLAGRQKEFVVNFADGGKFIGKYVAPPEQPKASPEGDYLVSATLLDGGVQTGWVRDFKPTAEMPNITSCVEKSFNKLGKPIAQIIISEQKTKPGGKKWPGVYHGSLPYPSVEMGRQAAIEAVSQDDEYAEYDQPDGNTGE